MRTAQRCIAQRRVGQQVHEPPAVQAAQCAKPKQPRQCHAQRAGQKRQNQKADRLGHALRHRVPIQPGKILFKTVPDALHPAILAVLLQRVPGGVERLFGVGVGVGAQPCRGVRVDPRAGERRNKLVHVLGVAALGIKIKPAHGYSVGAKIMVGLVGGLHRRVGKGEQHAAQQNACRALFGKVPDPPQRQRRRTGQHSQPHAKAGHARRRYAAGVQPVEHAPVVADDDAQRGADRQHESPPGGGLLHGG